MRTSDLGLARAKVFGVHDWTLRQRTHQPLWGDLRTGQFGLAGQNSHASNESLDAANEFVEMTHSQIAVLTTQRAMTTTRLLRSTLLHMRSQANPTSTDTIRHG